MVQERKLGSMGGNNFKGVVKLSTENHKTAKIYISFTLFLTQSLTHNFSLFFFVICNCAIRCTDEQVLVQKAGQTLKLKYQGIEQFFLYFINKKCERNER